MIAGSTGSGSDTTIVDDPTYMLGEITESNATPLNEHGRARIRELINELDALQT
jgi:hypothetical protein